MNTFCKKIDDSEIIQKEFQLIRKVPDTRKNKHESLAKEWVVNKTKGIFFSHLSKTDTINELNFDMREFNNRSRALGLSTSINIYSVNEINVFVKVIKTTFKKGDKYKIADKENIRILFKPVVQEIIIKHCAYDIVNMVGNKKAYVLVKKLITKATNDIIKEFEKKLALI